MTEYPHVFSRPLSSVSLRCYLYQTIEKHGEKTGHMKLSLAPHETLFM